MENYCVICHIKLTDHADLHGEPPNKKLKTDLNPEVVVTTCLHKFHKECLEKWLEVKKECPTCRHATSKEQLITLPADWSTHVTDLQDNEERALDPTPQKSNTKTVEKTKQLGYTWKSWAADTMNNLFGFSSSDSGVSLTTDNSGNFSYSYTRTFSFGSTGQGADSSSSESDLDDLMEDSSSDHASEDPSDPESEDPSDPESEDPGSDSSSEDSDFDYSGFFSDDSD